VTARRLLLVVTTCGAAATAVALVLGYGATVALAAALVLAAAFAVTTVIALMPAKRPRRPPPARQELPLRLRQIGDALRESEQSEFGVDRSLRPLLVPIAAARLGRRGIDMALAPRRAQELLGDRLWEIVRPDRPSAATRVGRGLAGDELREVVERLETL
jgi:hypothetical protein